jgi:hypothetical protein
MKVSRTSSLLLPFALWGMLAFGTGCGRQGEGERCDRLNGDEDCSSGLVCTDSQDLGTNADICCPADLSAATALACIPQSSGGTGGGGGSNPTTSSTGGGGGMGGSTGGMGGSAGGMGGSTGGMGGTASGGGGSGGQ